MTLEPMSSRLVSGGRSTALSARLASSLSVERVDNLLTGPNPGMLASAATIETIAEALVEHKAQIVVVDPVCREPLVWQRDVVLTCVLGYGCNNWRQAPAYRSPYRNAGETVTQDYNRDSKLAGSLSYVEGVRRRTRRATAT